MSKIDLNEIAEKIQNAKSSTELSQYLSTLLYDFDKGLRQKSGDHLLCVKKIPKLLHKVARKITASKAYVCGVYSAKFERIIEEYDERLIQSFRTKMLAKKLIRNIYDYLHKNGMTEVDQIIQDFASDKIDEKSIRGALKQLTRTGLVTLIYVAEYDYYELTPDGYRYYYNYFYVEKE